MPHPSVILKPFETHGVEFTGERGDERYGTCPFTGKPDKFYVNVKKGLWDSKTAGMSGNVSQFLHQIAKMYKEQMTEVLLKKLADDRNLPPVAFKPWHVGWDGRAYTIPIYDIKGNCTDIRMFKIGRNVISTAGCQVGLLGAEHLAGNKGDPVYLFEGEWDTIAAKHLMGKVGAKGICVGVPGAGIFKPEWVNWFNRRIVHTHYDKDPAGDAGEQIIDKRLSGIVRQITFTHWPEELQEGFDVRDWIVYGLNKKTPKKSWARLQNLYELRPRLKELPPPKPGTIRIRTDKQGKQRIVWKKPPTLNDVHTTFRKWLFLESTDGIDVMMACALSQRLEGPPVWLFLVGPPGSAKTELITSMSDLDEIYATSTVSPRALISGANFQGQKSDPSLIPRLDQKVLVIKDFTAVMGAKDQEKEEIFSILRDAYDGQCGKIFGNGVERSYVSRFTVIAAVTPLIYDMGSKHAQLGERFLKFSMADNLHHESEHQIMERAIDNTDRESKMRQELKDVVREFVNRTLRNAVLPSITPSMKERIIWLGRFGARMRGTVSRDKYDKDIMTSRPTAEVGSRLGIQLAKLARSVALLNQREKVSEEDYLIVKKVMLDTVMQRTEDVLRVLYTSCPTIDQYMSTKEIARATRYPMATVSRLLQDLHVLDIVIRKGSSYQHRWTVSEYIRTCIGNSNLYQTPEELTRTTGTMLKIRKKRKKKIRIVEQPVQEVAVDNTTTSN
jgi:MoxR-like ATPase